MTDRLLCRGIQRQDAEQIVRWRSDPEVYRHFLRPQPVSLAEHLRWYESYLRDDTRLDLLCIDFTAGKKLGVVGLQNLSRETVDVAYLIGEKDYQRKGYGSEAVAAMTRFAFERFPVRAVRAIIANGNLPSRKLVEGLGFQSRYQIYSMERTEPG